MFARRMWPHGMLLGAALVAGQGSCAIGFCPACDKPEPTGALDNPAIAEASGIAASAIHDDVFYTHNDAGDPSRIFAISRAGTHLATFAIEPASNDDWEDIAVAPCDAGSCIYIGDLGDNDDLEPRTRYAVYRVVEPPQLSPAEQTLPAETLEFTYEDGRHDAEVLLVHPRTGVVTIVTKATTGPAGIYELRLTDEPRVAVRRGEIEPHEGDHEFTGGAVHPDATGVLLRTETHLFFAPMSADQTVAEALVADACVLRSPLETQGEAVTWLRSGDGFVTVGERVGAPINHSRCDNG